MSVLQIASNSTIAKVFNADRQTKLFVSELLSYEVEGAEHIASYKSGQWTGISTFFDFKACSFPAGFVQHVRSSLENRGDIVQVVRKPLSKPKGIENPKVDEFPEDPRYDYQPETIKRLLDRGRMVAQIATGGGKSRVAKLAYKTIMRPTLFLTTRGVLMHQMKSSFQEMGEKVGVIGDGELQPSRGFNVGMVQTFAAMLKQPASDDSRIKQKRQKKRRDMAIKLLNMFEFVILEEAHEVGGNSYYEILRLCKNAEYRLALTATPFMRGDSESNMRLMASVGSVGIKVTEKLLIDRGILAKPIFKIIDTEKPIRLYRTTPWQKAYKIGIVENSKRNLSIIFEAERAAKYGLPVMILVQHKAHGEILKKSLLETGVRAEFIYGKHESDQRTKTLKNLGSGKIDVLIGSTILDVGVDVPAVGMVILAGGGKAEVALRQRIGRGLRAKKSGPNVAFIVDYADNHNKHLKGHALTRRAIIDKTKGFSENILPVGADFDYAEFR